MKSPTAQNTKTSRTKKKMVWKLQRTHCWANIIVDRNQKRINCTSLRSHECIFNGARGKRLNAINAELQRFVVTTNRLVLFAVQRMRRLGQFQATRQLYWLCLGLRSAVTNANTFDLASYRFNAYVDIRLHQSDVMWAKLPSARTRIGRWA